MERLPDARDIRGGLSQVKIFPEDVPADSYERFALSVPRESGVPTTEVKVEIPEGFEVVGVQLVPAWVGESEEDGDVVVRAIAWAGREIEPEEFQEFVFQTRTPEVTDVYSWSAFQAYANRTVAVWIGPEDTEESASLVEVVEGGSESDKPSVATPGSGGGFAQVAANGGLRLGILALVVALLALLLARRKPSEAEGLWRLRSPTTGGRIP